MKGTKLFQWVSSVPVRTVTSFLICVTWLIYCQKGEKHSFPTKLEPCVFMLIWPSYGPHNKSVPNIGTLLSITVHTNETRTEENGQEEGEEWADSVLVVGDGEHEGAGVGARCGRVAGNAGRGRRTWWAGAWYDDVTPSPEGAGWGLGRGRVQTIFPMGKSSELSRSFRNTVGLRENKCPKLAILGSHGKPGELESCDDQVHQAQGVLE